MAKMAEAGKVMTQLMIIFCIVFLLIPLVPSTNVTPVIAPIKQWVVETLRPNCFFLKERQIEKREKKKGN